MSELKLLVLGPLRLETKDGESVGRLGAKAKALLAYLAMQPDGHVKREVLANLLWDSCPQAEARHALRQALLTLRGQLGGYANSLLHSDRDSLQLRAGVVMIDVLRFETALRSGSDDDLTQACNLWRGSLCDGLDIGAEPFEDWLLRERARLDDLAAVGFRRFARLRAAIGDYEAAIEAVQRCVALDPFDDSAHAALIELYGRCGRVGSARKVYRRCVELFRRELAAVPHESVQSALAVALELRDRQPMSRNSVEATGNPGTKRLEVV